MTCHPTRSATQIVLHGPLRPLAGWLAPLALALGVLGAGSARADALKEAFLGLPAADRVAVQTVLAQADLYLSRTDGLWSSSTERALHRGADKVAQLSRDRIHPVLHRPEGARSYLNALQTGQYASMLIVEKEAAGWTTFLTGN